MATRRSLGDATPENATKVTRGQCEATTARGTPCKAGTRPGARYCLSHDPARRTEAQAARRRGGHNRAAPTPCPPCDLKSPSALIAELERTVDRMRRGDEPINLGKAVIAAISAARGPIQDAMYAELDRRMALLEDTHDA
jgi:hypothetical protein